MPKAAAAPAPEQTHHNVNDDLVMLLTPVSELRLDPRNARAHDAKDIAAVAASYDVHGQQKPIVALEDGTVIAGNGQLLAARKLGWTHIAVVRYRDEEQARSYALADNRTAELSRWDDAELARQLAGLAEVDALAGTGFTDEDLTRLANAANAAAKPKEEDAGKTEPTPPGPEGGLDVRTTNGARMVQVYLTDETYPRFMTAVRKLAVAYGVDNLNDVVVRALDEALASSGDA